MSRRNDHILSFSVGTLIWIIHTSIRELYRSYRTHWIYIYIYIYIYVYIHIYTVYTLNNVLTVKTQLKGIMSFSLRGRHSGTDKTRVELDCSMFSLGASNFECWWREWNSEISHTHGHACVCVCVRSSFGGSSYLQDVRKLRGGIQGVGTVLD